MTLTEKLFTRDCAVWQGRIRNQIINRCFAIRWGRFTDSEDEDETRFLYEPASWLILRIALRGQPVPVNDAFIDIGCGKGRVVLQAARYPFRRVIGLDRSDPMIEIARKAIEHNRTRLKCQQVELIRADVNEYEIPTDVGVVFCFPWRNAVSEIILSKVLALADARGSAVLFIYYLPTEHKIVQQSGRARLVKSLRPFAVTHAYPLNVYEILPSCLAAKT